MILSWRTGSEIGVLGYEIRRGGTRVNSRPIPATRGQLGSTYDFLDRSASPGRAYEYRLVAIEFGGARRRVGKAWLSAR